MPKYCPSCGHAFPDDWDECNECEVELIYEEKDRVLELSDMDKKYYDYISRVCMDEECSRREMEQGQYIPKCPTCGSTNIRRISSTERGINAAIFGLFGNKRTCQFECLNSACKYRW